MKKTLLAVLILSILLTGCSNAYDAGASDTSDTVADASVTTVSVTTSDTIITTSQTAAEETSAEPKPYINCGKYKSFRVTVDNSAFERSDVPINEAESIIDIVNGADSSPLSLDRTPEVEGELALYEADGYTGDMIAVGLAYYPTDTDFIDVCRVSTENGEMYYPLTAEEADRLRHLLYIAAKITFSATVTDANHNGSVSGYTVAPEPPLFDTYKTVTFSLSDSSLRVGDKVEVYYRGYVMDIDPPAITAERVDIVGYSAEYVKSKAAHAGDVLYEYPIMPYDMYQLRMKMESELYQANRPEEKNILCGSYILEAEGNRGKSSVPITSPCASLDGLLIDAGNMAQYFPFAGAKVRNGSQQSPLIIFAYPMAERYTASFYGIDDNGKLFVFDIDSNGRISQDAVISKNFNIGAVSATDSYADSSGTLCSYAYEIDYAGKKIKVIDCVSDRTYLYHPTLKAEDVKSVYYDSGCTPSGAIVQEHDKRYEYTFTDRESIDSLVKMAGGLTFRRSTAKEDGYDYNKLSYLLPEYDSTDTGNKEISQKLRFCDADGNIILEIKGAAFDGKLYVTYADGSEYHITDGCLNQYRIRCMAVALDKGYVSYDAIIEAAHKLRGKENVYNDSTFILHNEHESVRYMRVTSNDIVGYSGDKEKLDVYSYSISYDLETENYFAQYDMGYCFDAKTGEYLGQGMSVSNGAVMYKPGCGSAEEVSQ